MEMKHHLLELSSVNKVQDESDVFEDIGLSEQVVFVLLVI